MNHASGSESRSPKHNVSLGDQLPCLGVLSTTLGVTTTILRLPVPFPAGASAIAPPGVILPRKLGPVFAAEVAEAGLTIKLISTVIEPSAFTVGTRLKPLWIWTSRGVLLITLPPWSRVST